MWSKLSRLINRIPIQIDHAALDEVGVNFDQQVSCEPPQHSVVPAIRLMLEHLQLTYVIRNDILMITTPAALERHPTTCVYNVHDVAGDSDKAIESLVDTITSCVATETWAENGGSQAQIRTVKPGLLVISQSPDVHEKIRGLLATIRKLREKSPGVAIAAPHANDSSNEDVVTKAYCFQYSSIENANIVGTQLRELIVNALPDEKWAGRLDDGQAVSVTALPDRVVVRQTPTVQEKVQKILSDSGIATPADRAFGRGGGGGGVNGGIAAGLVRRAQFPGREALAVGRSSLGPHPSQVHRNRVRPLSDSAWVGGTLFESKSSF